MFSCSDNTEWNSSCSDMRVSVRWSYSVLLVFVAVPLWQACGLSMEEVCRYWSGSGHIGDSRDCKGWGYCKNNKLIARGQCEDNLFYDSRSGMCKRAPLVQCAAQTWELCAHRRAGEYVADPLNCNSYMKCGGDDDGDGDGDGANDEQFSCPHGYMFSDKLQTCVTNANGCPQENFSICAYMRNGDSVGDPLNCGLYLECQNGKGYRRACSAARYFNYETGRCQTTVPKYCPAGEGVYTPGKCPPPAMDFSVCVSYYQESHSGVQLISDAQTCHGYYQCNSRYGFGTWHSCPHGTHFQWWSQSCVPPEAYSCPYDRCGNRNSTLVTVINSGCTEFISCANQVSQQLSPCPEMYPYFDERVGACSKEFPNYTVCYMAG